MREEFHALCEALGKTAVEVPDVPGFVVNRLLFPFAFEAVRLAEDTGMEPKAIDSCMKLGAAHPLGPLALLDLVGLDVAVAIGESIDAEVPARVREMVDEGRLGRKSGAGLLRVRLGRLAPSAGATMPDARSHTTSASSTPWAAAMLVTLVPRQHGVRQIVPARVVERLERSGQ